MCGSKFSLRPQPLKRPTVCKKSPPATPPNLLPSPPLQLNAYVDFVDLDPLQPGRQVAPFQLDWHTDLNRYFGRSGIGPSRLELTAVRKPNPDFYDVLLQVWDAYRTAEPFPFFDVYVDPSKPFDTGKFGEVILSGTDFRTLQLME